MKTRTILFGCFVTVLFSGLAGCASSGESLFKPHREGYEVVPISRHRDLMHEHHRNEIYYWDKHGKKTLIWRYRSNQFFDTNDLALFHGYLTTGPDDPGGATRRSVERLFVVEGSAPVVDITDDVLRLWIGTKNADFLKKVKTSRVGNIQKKGDGFSIEVYQWGGGDGTVELSRNELLKMIREAKEKGKQMKNPGFGTPYLRRDWKAELSKQ